MAIATAIAAAAAAPPPLPRAESILGWCCTAITISFKSKGGVQCGYVGLKGSAHSLEVNEPESLSAGHQSHHTCNISHGATPLHNFVHEAAEAFQRTLRTVVARLKRCKLERRASCD